MSEGIVAAYVRVSSRAQTEASQIEAIRRASVARGEPVQLLYKEKQSGKTLERPRLTAMREAARRGELAALWVFRLDRLTRSGIRDTFEIVDELRRHGVKLRSVADGFDLEGPAAEVVLAVLAWAAKAERLAINERISAARERIEDEGGTWGRPSRADPKTVERALIMRGEGKSVRAIAVALKVPRATVGRLVKGAPDGSER